MASHFLGSKIVTAMLVQQHPTAVLVGYRTSRSWYKDKSDDPLLHCSIPRQGVLNDISGDQKTTRKLQLQWQQCKMAHKICTSRCWLATKDDATHGPPQLHPTCATCVSIHVPHYKSTYKLYSNIWIVMEMGNNGQQQKSDPDGIASGHPTICCTSFMQTYARYRGD